MALHLQAGQRCRLDCRKDRKPYRFKIQQAVYNWRLRKASEALSDLEVELLEAQVSWGNDATAAIQPLQKSAAKLYSVIRRHIRRLLRGREMTPAEELDLMLYNDSQEDPFSKEIKLAVETAEKFLQKHLKL